MDKIYLICILSLVTTFSLTQSVEIVRASDPSTDISGTEIEVIGTDSDITIYSELRVINKSGNAINMAFKRRRLIDSEELDQICDNQGCYNAADTYEWTTSPVEIPDGDTSLFKPQIMPNGNDFCGLHAYFVVDDQGVVYDSITIKIRTGKENCSLNIKEESISDKTISIYPNPAQKTVNIETPSNGKLIFLDALGKQVLTTEISGNDNNIDISTLKNGIYFVQNISNKGVRSETKKLIVQK
ncbi:MAG: T9SS type A sorting domain-containing protein [Brumimicrobium sp.]